MQNLLDGIVKFRREDFEAHRDLFTNLKAQQTPHTLVIACSDSRVDPNLITGTLPGELFIIRNIANMVPPYRKTADYAGVTSAIEYAVLFLNVKNIIVCGHSNCGGCAACLKPEEYLSEMPHTQTWLQLANPVRDRILREIPAEDTAKREWIMEQANVVEQLKHLITYPYIKERMESRTLMISGWHYIIETGEILIYDRLIGGFRLGNA